MKTKVIAMLNNKGGVGKTTCIANLGFSLAKKGRDVLLIDFDSQASLTNYVNVGIGDENYYGVYEMLVRCMRDISYEEDSVLCDIDPSTDEGFAELCQLCITRPKYFIRRPDPKTKKMVDEAVEFGFDLLPGKLDLSDFELEMVATSIQDNSSYAYRLYNIVQKIIRYHEYDYILIDCNPSLGVMAMNAVTAAVDGVLIPTNLDLMSTRGINNLIDKVVDVQEMLYKVTNGTVKHMGIIGIILNLYAERRNVDRAIQEDLDRYYPFTIFKTTIPESVNAKKALFAGALYAQMYPKAEAAFDKLADEVEEQMKKMEEAGAQIGVRIDANHKTPELEEVDDE